MPTEADRIAAAIDETRRVEHWRDHDERPDARAFRSRGRVPPEIVRSQTRLRTAAWRNTMDRRKAADSREIGMAMLHALITSKRSEITRGDKSLIARMLMDLDARGYDVKEAKATLRRMRNRYVDPGDRQGEAGDDMPF